MSGNVIEWEDSIYSPDGITSNMLVRGGAWNNEATAANMRCDVLDGNQPSSMNDFIGFRCCN